MRAVVLAVIAVLSNPAWANSAQARDALAQKEYARVLQIYASSTPSTAPDFYRQAIAFARLGNWQPASWALSQAIALDPSRSFGTSERIAKLEEEILSNLPPTTPAVDVVTPTFVADSVSSMISPTSSVADVSVTGPAPAASTSPISSTASVVAPAISPQVGALNPTVGVVAGLGLSLLAVLLFVAYFMHRYLAQFSQRQSGLLREEIQKFSGLQESMIDSLQRAKHPQMLLAHIDAFIEASLEVPGGAESHLVAQLQTSRATLIREIARQAYLAGRGQRQDLAPEDRHLLELADRHAKKPLSVSADPEAVRGVFQASPAQRFAPQPSSQKTLTK